MNRARVNHAPMRVRTATDGSPVRRDSELARRHGLKIGAMLRAVIDELLAGAEQKDGRGD